MEKVAIKSYLIKELAVMYGITPQLLRKQLNNSGLSISSARGGRILTVKEVELIFNELGHPRK